MWTSAELSRPETVGHVLGLTCTNPSCPSTDIRTNVCHVHQTLFVHGKGIN